MIPNGAPVKPFQNFRKNSGTQIEPVPDAPGIFSWPLKVFLGLCLVFIAITIYFSVTQKRGNKTNNPLLVSTPTPISFKAKVVYLEGMVWKDMGGQMEEMKEDDVLVEKDKLITGGNTRLVLVFDEGSVVRFGEKTRITLTKLSPAEMRINNIEGELFARVQKTPDHRFFITAGKVIVESLGTVFSVENKGEVKVNVYDHSVKVTDGSKVTEIGKKEQWRGNQNTVAVLKETDYENNKFLSWSLAEEAKNISVFASPTITSKPVVILTVKPMEKKAEAPTIQPSSAESLILSGKAVSDGVVLNWEAKNLDNTKGYKLVKSLNENPVYPGSDFVFFDSPSSSSFFWEIKDGRKWHFRVCQFLPTGKCGVYSNDLALDAPAGSVMTETNSSGNVKSINLTGEKSGVLIKLNWTVDGYSFMGYKVVWSTNSQPVYPSRDGDSFHYFSDPGKRSDEISNLISGKTYYVRVCEYLGGKCGVYSNELSL